MVDEYQYEITMIHNKTDSFLLKTNPPTPSFLRVAQGPKKPNPPHQCEIGSRPFQPVDWVFNYISTPTYL